MATKRIDVSCRLLFIAEIGEEMLNRGSGFTVHTLEQNALNLLKKGKRGQDFFLTIVEARVLPDPPRAESEVQE